MRIHQTLGLFALGFACAVVLASDAPRAQQHSYTQQEIDAGRALYDANCGRCHSDDGGGVTGIELFKQIRRGNSDEDIAKLIQNGIPATSMPPHQFTTTQALNVVAYLRSMVGVAPRPAGATVGGAAVTSGLTGDVARGKTVFETKGGCVSCHAVGGTGGTTGPDLAPAPGRNGGAGGRGGGRGGFGPQAPSAAALERSILEPDADVAVQYRVFQVVTKSNQTTRGTLLNQDTFSIQLRDQAGELRAFQKSDLKEFGFQPSPMPSYRGRLAPQEVADVIAYLISVRGQR